MIPPQCISQSNCHSFELILTSFFKAGTKQSTQKVKSSSATCSLSPQISTAWKNKVARIRACGKRMGMSLIFMPTYISAMMKTALMSSCMLFFQLSNSFSLIDCPLPSQCNRLNFVNAILFCSHHWQFIYCIYC